MNTPSNIPLEVLDSIVAAAQEIEYVTEGIRRMYLDWCARGADTTTRPQTFESYSSELGRVYEKLDNLGMLQLERIQAQINAARERLKHISGESTEFFQLSNE